MNGAAAAFALSDFRYAFGLTFYRQRILPSLIAGWGVWVPTITLVYCLPPLLQLPVSALATCFWSLLVVYMQSAKRV
jgi:FtsH-binding integral membrane protein